MVPELGRREVVRPGTEEQKKTQTHKAVQKRKRSTQREKDATDEDAVLLRIRHAHALKQDKRR